MFFLNKRISYSLILLSIIGLLRVSAQVGAPSLRCASVNNINDIVLTWVIPSDPSGLFTSYEIYSSPTTSGFALVGTVNTYTQNTYSHASVCGNMSVGVLSVGIYRAN